MMDAAGGGAGPLSRRRLSASSRSVTLMILLVCAITQSVATSSDKRYTDEWAVRIDGSDDDARLLAKRHGFVYVDKVGS